MMASSSNPEPSAKRRKLGASDRITLDVGGTTFVTAASTLTTNSTYFASLLSESWRESNDGDELFLDQDPAPFKILLAYMRRGMIKVEDIDTDVLALAEFLGMEKFLLAVKIRWYINIGKGPVLSEDDEAAAAFDREHGGILNAISAGLFVYFLKKNDIGAEKDYAFLKLVLEPAVSISVVEVVNGEQVAPVDCNDNTYVGALNGIYAKGYSLDEDPINHDCKGHSASNTFSRMRHSVIRSSATNIFIPTNDEVENQKEANYTKQFALFVKNLEGTSESIVVSAAFSGDNPDPFATVEISDEDGAEFWLERHNFVTREKRIEEFCSS